LNGLKVKFISSLMGVFFSIIVKLCQSFSNNRTSGTYHPPIQVTSSKCSPRSVTSPGNMPGNTLCCLKLSKPP
jgi:hypothetical protein